MKNTYFPCFFELAGSLAPPKNTWLCISITIPLLSLFIHQFIYLMICSGQAHLRVAHGPVSVTWYVMSHPRTFIIQENLCYCMSCLVTVCPPVPSKYQHQNVNLHPVHPLSEDVVKSALQELWHIASTADTVYIIWWAAYSIKMVFTHAYYNSFSPHQLRHKWR